MTLQILSSFPKIFFYLNLFARKFHQINNQPMSNRLDGNM